MLNINSRRVLEPALQHSPKQVKQRSTSQTQKLLIWEPMSVKQRPYIKQDRIFGDITDTRCKSSHGNGNPKNTSQLFKQVEAIVKPERTNYTPTQQCQQLEVRKQINYRNQGHGKEYMYPVDDKENYCKNQSKTEFIPRYRELTIKEKKQRDYGYGRQPELQQQISVKNSQVQESKQQNSKQWQDQEQQTSQQCKNSNRSVAQQLAKSTQVTLTNKAIPQTKPPIQKQVQRESPLRPSSIPKRPFSAMADKEIAIIQMSLEGIDQGVNSKQLGQLCKQQGYHMVKCSKDYNMLNHQETGHGQLMLRGVSNDSKIQKLQKTLSNNGIRLNPQSHNLKDVISNVYVQQAQQIPVQQSKDKLYNNYQKFQNRVNGQFD